MLTRFAANFDTRCRFLTVQRFMAENPQSADESKHDYMRRVHWAVLTTHGLPPLSIVKFWLSHDKFYVLAPIDLIEKYCIENITIPLPDGKLDQRITNGEGRMIWKLLRSLEDSKRQPEPGSHDKMGLTSSKAADERSGSLNALMASEPGQIPGGFWRVMAEQVIINKPVFGGPYLKLEECFALWGNVFDLGGVLGAKHAAKLDAFVSAFLGLTGEADEAKRVLVARANYLLGRHSLNSMKSWHLIATDFAERIGYKGDPSGLLDQRGMEKISPDVAARNAWNYARDGVALAIVAPDVVRAMFERSYAAVSKEEWQKERASGDPIIRAYGPEPPAARSYEETTEQDNKRFIDYCRQFRADVYSLLKD